MLYIFLIKKKKKNTWVFVPFYRILSSYFKNTRERERERERGENVREG